MSGSSSPEAGAVGVGIKVAGAPLSYFVRFASLEAAREWFDLFATWYHTEHQHSGIGLVRPEQRHLGLDHTILEGRKSVLGAIKQKAPGSWSGKTGNCPLINEVRLKPEPDVPVLEAS